MTLHHALSAFKKRKKRLSSTVLSISYYHTPVRPVEKPWVEETVQIKYHLSPCPAPWPCTTTTVAWTSQEGPSPMLVAHGAGCQSKILQDRYLARLKAGGWISCFICPITFKTRFSFKEHMKSSGHLLATGPGGVGFVGEINDTWRYNPVRTCDIIEIKCRKVLKVTGRHGLVKMHSELQWIRIWKRRNNCIQNT